MAKRSRSCARLRRTANRRLRQIYVLRMDGGEARAAHRPRARRERDPNGPLTANGSRSSPPPGAWRGQDRAGGAGSARQRCDKVATSKSSRAPCIARTAIRAMSTMSITRTCSSVRVPDEPADKPMPEQITDGEFDERGLAWAPDGSKMYFTSTRVAEPYYEPQHSELYSVPAAGGSITKVASIDGTISDRVDVARRQADRLSSARCTAIPSAPTASPICSSPTRRPAPRRRI